MTDTVTDGEVERRKIGARSVFGVTYGEWIGLVVLVSAAIAAYAVRGDTILDNEERSKKNEAAVQELHGKIVTEVQLSEIRTRQEVQRSLEEMQRSMLQSEQRTREDFRELRQFILGPRPPP